MWPPWFISMKNDHGLVQNDHSYQSTAVVVVVVVVWEKGRRTAAGRHTTCTAPRAPQLDAASSALVGLAGAPPPAAARGPAPEQPKTLYI